MKNKKGVSAVVATSLILLITVASVTIVWGVVIPLVKDNLDNAKVCLNAASVVSIRTASGLTCYNSSSKVLYLQLERSAIDSDLSKVGLRAIDINGNAKSQEILVSSVGTGLKAGDIYRWNSTSYNTTITSVEIIPIMKVGSTEYPCTDAINTIQIPVCA